MEDFVKIKKKLFFQKNIGLIGALLCSTPIIFTDFHETIKTDGKSIYINPDYYNSLCEDDKLFCLAHVLWNIAFMHKFRCNDKDKNIWNIAAAIVINNILIENNFKSSLDLHPVYEPLFSDLSTEDVYLEILDNHHEYGDSSLFNTLLIDDTKPREEQLLDEKEVLYKIKSVRKQDLTKPEIIEVIDIFFKPKINWRVRLKKFFHGFISGGYSYSRPSTRYDYIRPTRTKKSKLKNILIFLDTSFSISDEEIRIFNSEFKAIKDKCNPDSIKLIQFDTRIHSVKEIKMNEEFKFMEITGRGGTDLSEPINYIKENPSSLAIIFSDLYVDYVPKKPNNTPILWVTTGNNYTKPNYGEFINIPLQGNHNDR